MPLSKGFHALWLCFMAETNILSMRSSFSTVRSENWHRRKVNSSLVQAMMAVRDGRAGAIVSAGSTGAVLAGGMRNRELRAIVPMSPAINIRDGARTGNMLGVPFDPENIPDELYFPADGDVGAGRMLRGNYVRVARLQK